MEPACNVTCTLEPNHTGPASKQLKYMCRSLAGRATIGPTTDRFYTEARKALYGFRVGAGMRTWGLGP